MRQNQPCVKYTITELFIPKKEGESREIRFKIETADIKAGKHLDTYGRTCGDASGKLTISYSEPVQENLLEATPEQRRATAKDGD